MATFLVSLSETDDDVLVQSGGDSDSSSDSSSSGSSSWRPSSTGSDSDDLDAALVPAVGPLPAWLPSVSEVEVSKRAHYALNYLQQACADEEKKNQTGKGKVGLRFGKGMLSVAARSLPDTVMAVPAPFTPPLNRLQLGSLKG